MLYADGNNVDEKDKLIMWGERQVVPSCKENRKYSLLQTWLLLRVTVHHLSGRNADPPNHALLGTPLTAPKSSHINN